MAKKKNNRKPPARPQSARPRGPVGSSANRSQRTRLLVVLGVVLVVVVGIVGALASTSDKNGDNAGTTTSSVGGSAKCVSDSKMDPYSKKVVHTDSPGYSGPLTPHDDPRYSVNPPSGGDHLSRAVGAGVYEDGRVPPDGNLVHSLEHGYVILWFKPDIPAADKAALEGVRAKDARDTLLVERANMDYPVAATAWGKRLLCQGVDTAALSSFIEKNRNQAPEKIPH
ncbi:MAG TPA: DUF3105 domain-containing protein [Acidimicrobiales bacterium]|jgi:hypothetical protein|nr:DUF3105 domain-containing protein [Acidimicrobiales bacterium]